MQAKLSINYKDQHKSYIQIGNFFQNPSLLTQFISSEQIMIVTDQNVAVHYLEKLKSILSTFHCESVIIEPGENNKTMESAQIIIGTLIEKGFTRDATLISLGGGMICDLVGFCASVYFRGVKLLHIPTSLLAQVDASIGGKTAINHALGKNIIGTIYQPKAVIIDQSTLSSLPDREYCSALSEIIKYALICDEQFFYWIESNIELILEREEKAIFEVIQKSCAIKAQITAKDEKETNELRVLLNLGHTMGHALEQITGYKELLHGEAVSLGLIYTACLSKILGYLNESDYERIRALIKKALLPTKLLINVSEKKLLEVMARDKKNHYGTYSFILLKGIGKVELKHSLPLDVIKQSLQIFGGRQLCHETQK